MGHYASEMQCSRCGKLRCTCPPSKDETANHWVVFQDAIWRAKDVENQHGFMYRVHLKHHAEKEDAEEQQREARRGAVRAMKVALESAEKKAFPDLPTTQEKLAMYEGLLHDIQLNAEVVMNGDNVGKLIGNICRWSYSHRCGNGENSEEEQDAIIAHSFRKLRDR